MGPTRLGTLDRLRFQARHHVLAATLGIGVGVWHWLLDRRIRVYSKDELATLTSRFRQALRHDLENVERGYYPRDLLFRMPLARYLSKTPAGLLEMPRVWRRRALGRWRELPDGVDVDAFPSYYRRNFHWQTDGWLSDRSAHMYDASVEFLFLGTADVMRRAALPPVVNGVRGVARPRVLDLGCGTGRMTAFIAAALPHARVAGLDLSPYYLRAAERELAEHANVSFALENAEVLPFANGTFDAVTAVFLFHELPKRARRNVMHEAHRILAPGGRFVLCDAAQLADSPHLAAHLTAFPRLYHEPYFRSYLRDDLAAALAECGFEVIEDATWMVSRIVVAQPRAESGNLRSAARPPCGTTRPSPG